MPNNTAFSPNPDFTGQVTGSGVALSGFPTQLGAGFVPTYAASINIGPLLQFTRFISLVTTSAIGNATLTCTTGMPPAGCAITIQVTNDSGGARTITFSTGFRFSAATLVGTASKIMNIDFMSDGTTLNETGRTIAMT